MPKSSGFFLLSVIFLGVLFGNTPLCRQTKHACAIFLYATRVSENRIFGAFDCRIIVIFLEKVDLCCVKLVIIEIFQYAQVGLAGDGMFCIKRNYSTKYVLIIAIGAEYEINVNYF